MSFEIPLDTTEGDTCDIEIFKSWRSFSDHFDDAVRMRVVTFCDSPTFILSLFEDIETLEHLEVIVGDIDDYRERLIDKPDTADRLERLRRDGKLTIYLCENKEVHSKLYLIDYGAENADQDAPTDVTGNPAKVIVGSANLSKNAWSNQTNMGAVFNTVVGSDLYNDFVDIYEDHRRSYNNDGPFLKDLTERLEQTDEDREKTINLFTEGKVGTADELGEVHGRLEDHIEEEVDEVNLVLGDETDVVGDGTDDHTDDKMADDSGPTINDPPQERINLSLRGHDESTVDTVSKMTEFDATLSGDTLSTTVQGAQRYKQEVFSVPEMHAKWENNTSKLKLHAEGHIYQMARQLPDDPNEVDSALAQMERYFETVDEYGKSNNPTAVKAHMMEALFWFFWAPFVNRQAAFYQSKGVNLDKALPYLYIHGESNGGKGTFAKYALGMISGTRVSDAVDADEIGKRKVRSLRSAHTSFPVVVDDITKQKVNNLDTLRNFWGQWTGQTDIPLFAFISNDKRPNEWFRNRAKILNFDVNFQTSRRGEAEVNELIEKPNPLYQWFSHEYLTRNLELADDDDTLREVRETMLHLYEYADRDIPEYFPTQPAERAFDTGRDRWKELLQRDDVQLDDQGDTLVVSFDEAMQTEMFTYQRDPPTTVRVEKRGLDLVIKTPNEFFNWIGDQSLRSSGGVLSKISHASLNLF